MFILKRSSYFANTYKGTGSVYEEDDYYISDGQAGRTCPRQQRTCNGIVINTNVVTERD